MGATQIVKALLLSPVHFSFHFHLFLFSVTSSNYFPYLDFAPKIVPLPKELSFVWHFQYAITFLSKLSSNLDLCPLFDQRQYFHLQSPQAIFPSDLFEGRRSSAHHHHLLFPISTNQHLRFHLLRVFFVPLVSNSHDLQCRSRR